METIKMVLTEQDIINTYSKKQQEQCELYFKYLEIKRQYPHYGHKKLAKLLNVPPHKLAYWHFKNPPVPVQTTNCLKQKT